MTELLLAQHIFTSRFSFETVAQTRSITPKIRGEIVQKAGQYPKVSRSSEDFPFVIRSFRVPEEGVHVIMLLYYLGSDLSGREGNYLAHSYVLTDSDLERTGCNLPWIAAHLPISTNFRPPPSGIAELPPLRCVVGEDGWFDQLSFLIGSLPDKNEFFDVVIRLVLSLEAGTEPVTLSLGPPPDEISELAEEFLNMPPPPPDVLNLWRMIGYFTLLPRAFQKKAEFSINELAVNPKFQINILRNQPKIIDPIQPAPGLKEYFAYCTSMMDDAGSDGREVLRRFLENMNKYLNATTTEALSACFEYCRRVLGPREASEEIDESIEAAYIAKSLHVQPSPPDALIITAYEFLGRCTDVKPEVKVKLLANLALSTLRSSDRERFHHVFTWCVRYYANSLGDEQKLPFLNELPDEFKVLWWNESEMLRIPPACPLLAPPAGYERRFVELQMGWMEHVFSKLGPKQRGNAVARLASALCGTRAAENAPGRLRVNDDYLDGFETLIRLQGVRSHAVRSDLLMHMARQMFAEPGRIEAPMARPRFDHCQSVLGRVLDRLVLRQPGYISQPGTLELISDFLLSIIRSADSQNWDDLTSYLIFFMPKQHQVMAQFLNAMRRHVGHLQLHISCQIEFLSACSRTYSTVQYRARGVSFMTIILPRYQEWAKRSKRKNVGIFFEQDPFDNRFYMNLRNELRALSAADAITMVMAYFIADPSNDNLISWVTHYLSQTNELAAWLNTRKYETQNGQVSTLFMFAECYQALVNVRHFNLPAINDCLCQMIHFHLGRQSETVRELHQIFKEYRIPVQILEKTPRSIWGI